MGVGKSENYLQHTTKGNFEDEILTLQGDGDVLLGAGVDVMGC